ncbi:MULTISPECIES: amidohydrolase [unclassified Brevibacterium]|uniref:amidohydrolase n=1 Tax=unclassified Brevibacterium TaxID=2614124 RepID=UPI001BA92235|nr:amidohydrolase [Brevibacterium sp. W7.2]
MNPEDTIVYPARQIRTGDPSFPVAEAVAVRGDRIRAVGTVEELLTYPGAVLDERYGDAVILPGFVEAHTHAGTGNVWKQTYVGFLDRTEPSGRHWPGCTSIDEVVERLRDAEAELDDPQQPLLAWGFDPIYFPGEAFTAAALDAVSPHRPIHVIHTSVHACVVNSAVMSRCDISADTMVPGVVKDSSGAPTGELREFTAMALVSDLTEGTGPLSIDAAALRAFGQEGVNTGTTTLTDLGSLTLMDDAGVDLYRSVVDETFPARLNVFHFGAGVGAPRPSLSDDAARLVDLAGQSSAHLRLGNVKLMLDGSIQGFTARLEAPGYFGDEPNGLWNVTPEEFYAAFSVFHRAGLLIHVHCNGDQATELFLQTLQRVLTEAPRPDHRHTCTHSQLTTAAQYRRLAALGACANIFANHIFAWGDQHMDITLGPDRARRMDAAATALREGVPISLHSDSPVTPLGPLRTITHAVTRRSQTGRVVGDGEAISVDEAVRAMTLGAAHMLHMDHEVGSLEAGKYADFAILADDPYEVDPDRIGDIHVRGTVVGGRHFDSRIAAPAGS